MSDTKEPPITMKATVSLVLFIVPLVCSAQTIVGQDNVLLKKEDARLVLDNGGLMFTNKVTKGDIYITTDFFVFRPKSYEKKRFGMKNGLAIDIVIPYDSILIAKKLIGGLMLQTETKKFVMAGGRNWKTIADQINQLKREHEARQDSDNFVNH